jgi:uncharacterized Zn finger protein
MTDSASIQSDRQWWTEQWFDLINSYRFKKRLERGWKYAREGHVLTIDFKDEKVLAQVQGTDPQPYQVSLCLEQLTDEDWDNVIETLAQRAIFSAKLLAGEMPHNIEEVFAANGLRLFPFKLADVKSSCTCPDKANPCKHISAVYYLMGDRFSEDPFVLFQLRGRTCEQILQALRQKRQAALAQAPEASPQPQTSDSSTVATNSLGEKFWAYDAKLDPSLVVITPTMGQETPVDLLGPLPLGTLISDGEMAKAQGQAVMDYLKQVYDSLGQQAMLKAMAQGNQDNASG